MQTPEGRRKAVETNLRNNPDYYKEMGRKNKGRQKSKPTGTQLLTPEERSERGRKAAELMWKKRKSSDGEGVVSE